MKNKQKTKRYMLGAQYQDIYFTEREAECITLLIEGKLYRQVGTLLGLSQRTVEFYSKIMQGKLNCHTKKELIEKVKNTEFFKCYQAGGLKIDLLL